MALSQPVGALLAELDRIDPAGFDCDVLIVGSGYGGAVAAARLAGSRRGDAAARIWLVERGAEYAPGDFPSRFAELPGHVRFTMADHAPRGRLQGLLDLRLGGDVAVLLGNGLGGGSLINANVMARPEPAVFEQGWPAAITAVALDESYEAAEAMLQPRRLPAGDTLRKFSLLQSLTPDAPAEAAPVTVAWTPFRSSGGIDMAECTRCGDCLTGCNQGAKGSLDTSYLAVAAAHGVSLFTGAAVQRVAAHGEGWAVHWCATEVAERSPAARPIRARCVVLAAGSLGSTEILMRSADQKLRQPLPVSTALGGGFSMNGDNIAAGFGHPDPTGTVADPEIDPAALPDAADPTAFETRRIGPTIVGLKRVAARGFGAKPGFVIEEFGVPGALRRVFGEIVATLAAVRGQTLPGLDPAGCTEAQIDRMSLFGLMGDDGAAGRLELPDGAAAEAAEGQARVSWPQVAELPLFASMKEWLTLSFAGQPPPTPTPAQPLPLAGEVADFVGAAFRVVKRQLGKVFAPVLNLIKDWAIDHVVPALEPAEVLSLLGGAAGMAVTVHPLGGCRMSDDPAQGVVNADGQVWTGVGGGFHKTLAVLDGAIVPRALGINPAFTITALAERAMPALRQAFGLTEGEVTPAAPARLVRPRRELAPAQAAWQLRERLQGPWPVGDQWFWARLSISYEEIPGFSRALQMPERVLNVRHARLTLQAWDGDPALAELMAPLDETPLFSATLSGSLHLFAPLDEADAPQDPLDRRVTLDYRLSVQAVDAPLGLAGNPLRVGARLFARKRIGAVPGLTFDRAPSWLRQLTEAEVRYDGQPLSRWRLDMDQLATLRDPLLSLLRQSSLPDALLDAITGGAHVTRLLRPLLVQAYAAGNRSPWAPNLDARWPHDLHSCRPQFFELKGVSCGARLTRYTLDTPQGLPVLLIHGMGAGGNSYTLPCLDAEADSLITALRKRLREVWVLDVRSSIANEAGRHSDASQHWLAERIASTDIPQAFDIIRRETGQPQLDVFAHCMGAVMLWMAVLGDSTLGPRIHAATFSQVAPLLRPTPYNRLRGFVMSYLLQFLALKEVDTTPDFEFRSGRWQRAPDRGAAGAWIDGLLATFPYPDDDGEADRADALGESGWRAVRHRADAIFGQLFELRNLADATVLQLDALLGWVKLPMLAQCIHFARLNELTDADGRNLWLDEANLRACLPFPLLLIHGRRNRVFDWHGAVQSLKLLKPGRLEAWEDPITAAGVTRYGAGTATELRIYEDYGHFDCVIGRQAGRDIFPGVLDFFDHPPALQHGPVPGAKPTATTPFIGPQLGALSLGGDGRQHLRVLLSPKSNVAHTCAVALVPVRWRLGRPEPLVGQAEVFDWRPADGKTFEAQVLALSFDRQALTDAAPSWAVLMLNQPVPATATGRVWQLAGLPSHAADAQTAQALMNALYGKSRTLFDDCQIHLSNQILDAADQGVAAPSAQPLRLAVGSCQYPPDLFDIEPAAGSFKALLNETARDDGPQLLLLLGDQVYLDATAGAFDPPAGASLAGAQDGQLAIRQSYEGVARLWSRRRTLARLPVLNMLDDHEVRDNWRGLQLEPKLDAQYVSDALKTYERYQQAMAPQVDLAGQPIALPRPPGASYSYRCFPGGVPLFVLDTRSQRSDGHILPPAELQELITQLQALPRAVPKLIVSPVPLLPLRRLPEGDAACRFEDDWAGFPASAALLLGALHAHDIRRVVLLSGDSHLSSLSRFSFTSANGSANQLVSVVSSGLYAPWPFANQRPDELRPDGPTSVGGVPGQFSVEALSTLPGHARVDLLPQPDGAPPKLCVRLPRGDDPQALLTHTIELT
jgi:choline dehydrogenase-like flavoprotein